MTNLMKCDIISSLGDALVSTGIVEHKWQAELFA